VGESAGAKIYGLHRVTSTRHGPAARLFFFKIPAPRRMQNARISKAVSCRQRLFAGARAVCVVWRIPPASGPARSRAPSNISC
jgi:hypothetical protein